MDSPPSQGHQELHRGYISARRRWVCLALHEQMPATKTATSCMGNFSPTRFRFRSFSRVSRLIGGLVSNRDRFSEHTSKILDEDLPSGKCICDVWKPQSELKIRRAKQSQSRNNINTRAEHERGRCKEGRSSGH